MKKVLGIIVLLFVCFGIIFFILKNIKIKNISCSSQYGSCNPILQSEIAKIKNKNILETRNELNKLLKNDNSVLSYSINFMLLTNFKVNVIERKAVVAFTLPTGEFALVDASGNILANVKETNLPKVTTAITLSHEEVIYITTLMAKLHILYNTNSASVTADGIFIDNIDGKKVIFPLSADTDVVIGSLVLIISRLPSVKEASTISVIDLRYKNPVLR